MDGQVHKRRNPLARVDYRSRSRFMTTLRVIVTSSVERGHDFFLVGSRKTLAKTAANHTAAEYWSLEQESQRIIGVLTLSYGC